MLNIHADYQCRHQGPCCTAGWHIPIEPSAFGHLRAAMAERILVAPGAPPGSSSTVAAAACFSTDAPPAGAAAIVGLDGTGACVFFDRDAGNLCAIQRACGHDSLPVTCQQFPRIALIDARGIHVTLSQYCPTAARMLFRDDIGGLSIVANPAASIRRAAYEGFDATGTIPPLMRPGLVADMEVAATWEAFAVRCFGCDGLAPEAALVRLAFAGERIREWKPGAASLATTARSACAAAQDVEPASRTIAPADAIRLFLAAVATVPEGLARPELPVDVDGLHARLVAPAWSRLSRPIRRYLAAKAFAAWSAYCGEGLRTQVALLAVALGVLAIESTRQAAREGRELNAEMLLEAIRQADFLLVHLASGDDLVRRFGRVEAMTRDAYLTELGVDLA